MELRVQNQNNEMVNSNSALPSVGKTPTNFHGLIWALFGACGWADP